MWLNVERVIGSIFTFCRIQQGASVQMCMSCKARSDFSDDSCRHGHDSRVCTSYHTPAFGSWLVNWVARFLDLPALVAEVSRLEN